jgi:hypothetical protein
MLFVHGALQIPLALHQTIHVRLELNDLLFLRQSRDGQQKRGRYEDTKGDERITPGPQDLPPLT